MTESEDLISCVVRRRKKADGKGERPGPAMVEKQIKLFLETFRFVSEMNETWREHVFRGIVDYSREQDAAIRAYFEQLVNWDERIEGLRSQLRNPKAKLKDFAEYEECLKAAKQIIDSWESPELSIIMGLREQTLDGEQTRQLREALDQR